jgi:hypothetical protein
MHGVYTEEDCPPDDTDADYGGDGDAARLIAVAITRDEEHNNERDDVGRNWEGSSVS